MSRAAPYYMLSVVLLWAATVLSHWYSHDERHADVLAFCAPLFAAHDTLSDTALGRPVYSAVNYVCGDF